MGDMGDVFAAFRKEGQEKRASNRENSARILAGAGIAFEAKNDGAHLVVRHSGKTVDFWPGTGKWIDRQGRKGRGVRGLLRWLA